MRRSTYGRFRCKERRNKWSVDNTGHSCDATWPPLLSATQRSRIGDIYLSPWILAEQPHAINQSGSNRGSTDGIAQLALKR